MVDVRSALNAQQSIQSGQAASARVRDGKPESDDIYAPKRVIRDTIDISDDGNKIINLGRHKELAKALPDAYTDRAAFDEALTRSLEDVNRITTLFGAVAGQLGGHQVFGENEQNATADPVDDKSAQTKVLLEQLRSNAGNNQKISAYFDTTRSQIRQITDVLSESLKSPS